MAASVIGDAAQALVGRLDELVLPDVGIEAPGLGEHHGLAGSPIDVEEARTVFGLDEGGPRCAGLLTAAGRPPAATRAATAAVANVVVALLLSIATSPQPRAGAASTKPTTDLMRPSPATTTKSVPLM